MMKRTLEDLNSKAGSQSFIYAKITPPNFDAEVMYRELKDKYPVEGMPGGEARQNTLAKRWDEMRDRVMSEGRVSI